METNSSGIAVRRSRRLSAENNNQGSRPSTPAITLPTVTEVDIPGRTRKVRNTTTATPSKVKKTVAENIGTPETTTPSKRLSRLRTNSAVVKNDVLEIKKTPVRRGRSAKDSDDIESPLENIVYLELRNVINSNSSEGKENQPIQTEKSIRDDSITIAAAESNEAISLNEPLSSKPTTTKNIGNLKHTVKTKPVLDMEKNIEISKASIKNIIPKASVEHEGNIYMESLHLTAETQRKKNVDNLKIKETDELSKNQKGTDIPKGNHLTDDSTNDSVKKYIESDEKSNNQKDMEIINPTNEVSNEKDVYMQSDEKSKQQKEQDVHTQIISITNDSQNEKDKHTEKNNESMNASSEEPNEKDVHDGKNIESYEKSNKQKETEIIKHVEKNNESMNASSEDPNEKDVHDEKNIEVSNEKDVHMQSDEKSKQQKEQDVHTQIISITADSQNEKDKHVEKNNESMNASSEDPNEKDLHDGKNIESYEKSNKQKETEIIKHVEKNNESMNASSEDSNEKDVHDEKNIEVSNEKDVHMQSDEKSKQQKEQDVHTQIISITADSQNEKDKHVEKNNESMNASSEDPNEKDVHDGKNIESYEKSNKQKETEIIKHIEKNNESMNASSEDPNEKDVHDDKNIEVSNEKDVHMQSDEKSKQQKEQDVHTQIISITGDSQNEKDKHVEKNNESMNASSEDPNEKDVHDGKNIESYEKSNKQKEAEIINPTNVALNEKHSFDENKSESDEKTNNQKKKEIISTTEENTNEKDNQVGKNNESYDKSSKQKVNDVHIEFSSTGKNANEKDIHVKENNGLNGRSENWNEMDAHMETLNPTDENRKRYKLDEKSSNQVENDIHIQTVIAFDDISSKKWVHSEENNETNEIKNLKENYINMETSKSAEGTANKSKFVGKVTEPDTQKNEYIHTEMLEKTDESQNKENNITPVNTERENDQINTSTQHKAVIKRDAPLQAFNISDESSIKNNADTDTSLLSIENQYIEKQFDKVEMMDIDETLNLIVSDDESQSNEKLAKNLDTSILLVDKDANKSNISNNIYLMNDSNINDNPSSNIEINKKCESNIKDQNKNIIHSKHIDKSANLNINEETNNSTELEEELKSKITQSETSSKDSKSVTFLDGTSEIIHKTPYPRTPAPTKPKSYIKLNRSMEPDVPSAKKTLELSRNDLPSKEVLKIFTTVPGSDDSANTPNKSKFLLDVQSSTPIMKSDEHNVTSTITEKNLSNSNGNKEKKEQSMRDANIFWNQNVFGKVKSGEKIDQITCRDENKNTSIVGSDTTASDDSDESNILSENEEPYVETEFVDAEAKEVFNYNSADSMNSSERNEIVNNEIIDLGKSTDFSDSSSEESENPDYENDSFLVSDSEALGYLTDAELQSEELKPNKPSKMNRISSSSDEEIMENRSSLEKSNIETKKVKLSDIRDTKNLLSPSPKEKTLNVSRLEILKKMNKSDIFNKTVQQMDTELQEEKKKRSPTSSPPLFSVNINPSYQKYSKCGSDDNSYDETTTKPKVPVSSKSKSLFINGSNTELKEHIPASQSYTFGATNQPFEDDTQVVTINTETNRMKDSKINDKPTPDKKSIAVKINSDEEMNLKELEHLQPMFNRLQKSKRQSLITQDDAESREELPIRRRQCQTIGQLNNDLLPSQSFVESLMKNYNDHIRLKAKRKRLSRSLCIATDSQDADVQHIHKKSKVCAQYSDEIVDMTDDDEDEDEDDNSEIIKSSDELNVASIAPQSAQIAPEMVIQKDVPSVQENIDISEKANQIKLEQKLSKKRSTSKTSVKKPIKRLMKQKKSLDQISKFTQMSKTAGFKQRMAAAPKKLQVADNSARAAKIENIIKAKSGYFFEYKLDQTPKSNVIETVKVPTGIMLVTPASPTNSGFRESALSPPSIRHARRDNKTQYERCKDSVKQNWIGNLLPIPKKSNHMEFIEKYLE